MSKIFCTFSPDLGAFDETRSNSCKICNSWIKRYEIAKAEPASLQPLENIENLILVIRGKQVMLDRDLARLYGVETRVLNQAVQRNIERFPEDFMFQLSLKEMRETSEKQGSYRFDITNCDLKQAGRSTLSPLRLHRKRYQEVNSRTKKRGTLLVR